MNNEKDGIANYLDYLDKEMTIMGILSTFCIVSLGFATDRLIFTEKEILKSFWINTPYLCAIGLIGLLFSGLLFYRERALLAWYYGQLSLYNAKADEKEVRTLLDDSDGWNNWVYYQSAFGFLFLSLTTFGLMILSTKIPYLQEKQIFFSILSTFIWFAVYSFKVNAYLKFPHSEEPEKELYRKIFKIKKARK